MSGGMEGDPKLIWEVVKWLAERQENDETYGPKREVRQFVTLLRLSYPAVAIGQLEQQQRDQNWSFPDRRYLYLPPDDKKGWKVPLLRMQISTSDGFCVLRLKIGFVVMLAAQTSAATHAAHCGIGVRFESAEAPKGKTRHDYPQAQLFCSFDKNSEGFPGCPDWLPVSNPAIPIDASNHGFEIFGCAMRSIYGSDSEICKDLKKACNSGQLRSLLGLENAKRLVGKL